MTIAVDTFECPQCGKYRLKVTTEIVDPDNRIVLKCQDCKDVFVTAAPELKNWILSCGEGEG